MHDFPLELQVAIRARFDSNYQSTEEGRETFRNVLKHVEGNEQIRCFECTNAGVLCTHKLSGGDKMEACHRCVNTSGLCARLLKMGGSLHFSV